MPDDDEMIPGWDEAAPPRVEARPFSLEQMVTCEACLRANPPTRTTCFYCAATLPATEASAGLRRPTLRRLEKWEQGFNPILLPSDTHHLSEQSLGEMADLLRIEADQLQRIVEAGVPLPLARTATADEASLIEDRLNALNVSVTTVADRDLGLGDAPPERIRSLKLTEDSLVAHPAGSSRVLGIAWTEILLFVVGRHFVRHLEVEERRGRGSEKEIAEARELSSDEMLLDVYTARSPGGWRISSGNFDFSCLGEKKGLLATANFSVLVEMLRERAPQARLDESYNRVRHALAAVWPLDQNTESRGLRRERPGKFNTESVTTIDNETQFTRYSRLRHHLKVHHPGKAS